jgi:hypothetical protein
MDGYKVADWGVTNPDGVQNHSGNRLFHSLELNWSNPTIWQKGQSKPIFDDELPFVYALIHDHPNAHVKDRIVYIGLTKSPKTRFGNHETAREISRRQGQVRFSYAQIKLTGRNGDIRTEKALQEIEHLLIWSVWEYLENQQKTATLPGMGRNGGQAWHITNSGYKFSGHMPREIVFPWMLVVPRRNRTIKAEKRMVGNMPVPPVSQNMSEEA